MTTLSKWEYNAGAKARKNPMFTINTFAAVAEVHLPTCNDMKRDLLRSG